MVPLSRATTRLACLALLSAALAPQPAPAQGGAGDGTVDFADILENPDDIDLNVAYANQQIEAGNLPAAASTLERLLIREPALDRVRLLYAILLYRLGQTQEATVEFAAIDAEALPPEDRRTLERFTRAAERAASPVTGVLGLTAGMHYDSNRNSFPLGGSFQVELPGSGGTLIPGAGDENADIGQFALVDASVTRDFGGQTLRSGTLYATGLVDNQVELDDLDVLSGAAGGALQVDAGPVDLEPSVTLLGIGLGGSRYLTAAEGRLGFSRAIGSDNRLAVIGGASGGYEDFSNVDADPFAEEQDGGFLRGEIGLLYTPVDSLQLTGLYRYTGKYAEFDFESFDAHSLRLRAQYVVAEGVSLTTGFAWTNQAFDEPDPFVSRTTTQTDNIIDTGLGVLVSARRIARFAGVEDPHPVLNNTVLNIGGRYRRVYSNLPNFEYENFRVEISLTKRFLF